MPSIDDYDIRLCRHENGDYIYVGDGEYIPPGWSFRPGYHDVIVEAVHKETGQMLESWVPRPVWGWRPPGQEAEEEAILLKGARQSFEEFLMQKPFS